MKTTKTTTKAAGYAKRLVTNFTVAIANKALKQAGYAERLVRGRGYYYFTEGAAMDWYSSSIMTNSIATWTVEQIIAERNRLASDYHNSSPDPGPVKTVKVLDEVDDKRGTGNSPNYCGGIDRLTSPITPTKEDTTMKTKTAKTAKTAVKTTTTKTAAAKSQPAKTAAKSAPAKAAKTVTATRVDAHPFLSSEAAALVCVSCGAAPSGKLHRRYMDSMRRMWKTGSAAERETYLTHIEDGNPAEAKLTWTALPAYTKRALAACLNLEAE